MIQEGITAITNALTARLDAALLAMPGVWGGAILSGGPTTILTRVMLDPKLYEEIACGVRVEQQDAVTLDWPLESTDAAAYPLTIGVTCWLTRAKVPELRDVTADDMCKAIRGLCRAVDYAIRAQFSPIGAVEIDGVQVRCPSQVTYGEPEQGDDENLTVMTLTLSVPVFDSWALSAGSV